MHLTSPAARLFGLTAQDRVRVTRAGERNLVRLPDGDRVQLLDRDLLPHLPMDCPRCQVTPPTTDVLLVEAEARYREVLRQQRREQRQRVSQPAKAPVVVRKIDDEDAYMSVLDAVCSGEATFLSAVQAYASAHGWDSELVERRVLQMACDYDALDLLGLDS